MIRNDLVLNFATVKLIGIIILGILFLSNIYVMYGRADVVVCKNLVCTFTTTSIDLDSPLTHCFIIEPTQLNMTLAINNQ